MQKEIRLKLKSFDYKIIDKALLNIISAISVKKIHFKGPISIPNKILKFIVNKSPHVHKKSREQFEIRRHSRLLIIESSPDVINILTKLNISGGIDIQVKINEKK